MTAAPTLLPCPFCGNTDIGVMPNENDDCESIWCCACFAEGPLADTVAEAIARWNGRVP